MLFFIWDLSAVPMDQEKKTGSCAKKNSLHPDIRDGEYRLGLFTFYKNPEKFS